MERRTWSSGEKARSIELFNAHKKALSRGADFSYPQHLGHPADKAEEELDRYLLNSTKDDLRFHVDKDGTKDVDEVHQWWNALHNVIKKYGTADSLQKQILIKRQRELENKHRDAQSAESHIKYLFNKQKEAEAFYVTFLNKWKQLK